METLVCRRDIIRADKLSRVVVFTKKVQPSPKDEFQARLEIGRMNVCDL